MSIEVTLVRAPVTLAEPLKFWPQRVRVVVRVAADPVVFWFSVGTSPAWMAERTTLVPLPRK